MRGYRLWWWHKGNTDIDEIYKKRAENTETEIELSKLDWDWNYCVHTYHSYMKFES